MRGKGEREKGKEFEEMTGVGRGDLRREGKAKGNSERLRRILEREKEKGKEFEKLEEVLAEEI